jgi:hypothetical protein
MALFRDHDLAMKVSEERLTLLIRETGTALLDPRLVVSSQGYSLDEATSTQVVRAINKLAVQAATGGSREASLSSLMTLQRQLSFEPTALNARLSRVVAKLFARVLKSEDADSAPWKSVDIDCIVRALDSHFTDCEEKEIGAAAAERDSIQSCKTMAVALVESLTKGAGIGKIKAAMARGKIDPSLSPLGKILKDFSPLDDPDKTTQLPSTNSHRPQTPSRGVASLVTALGSAQSQSERDRALRALRHYTAEYGEEDLNLHLEQVSPVFRNFILEQLSLRGTTEDENESVGSTSMAERLRNLRSRLHAKEGQTGVSYDSQQLPPTSTRLIPPSPSRASALPSQSDVSVDTAAVSTTSTSASSHQSLRERLAAAQENRKNSVVVPETSSTSGSRAAALRARLQAVKQQAAMHSSK